MKLFIWNDPYKVSYGGSSVHVVAETLEDAKKLAASKLAITFSYGKKSFEQNDWRGAELGAPTDILEIPCAVWDYWQE